MPLTNRSRKHVPFPPRHGKVLERGPAHGRTQSVAHRTGDHGGVVRPVARPTGRVEGPDIVCPRHVPERDAGLDVADTAPRGGLPHPAEEEEVLPVRALDPDVLEREGRLCRTLPAGPLDLDGLENSDKAPKNKIYRRASSEKRLRTRSCHESERLI